MFQNRITHHPAGFPLACLLAALLFAYLTQTATAQTASSTNGATYYLSLSGNDNSSGTSQSSAWRSFARAWQSLQPGDTLLVVDGTYVEPIQPNVRNGQPGNPITIRAQNDGQVTIDGQGQRIPVLLGIGENAAIGNWYVIEGIIARNGTESAFRVIGDNNVLRRVSGYNADSNGNSNVIFIWGDNNLVEDAVAAGTGRYMIEVYQGSGNTIRRALARWESWEGRSFCGVAWPNGQNVGVYNASNTTVENVIAYGRSLIGIFIQANSDTAVANNNAVLGSMALLQGRDYDRSPWTYGTGQSQPTARPAPSDCPTNLTQWWWGTQRFGMGMWGQGTMQNNVFRDVLSTGNMGVGFTTNKPYGIGDTNTTLDHATMYGNGADIPGWEGAQGGNIFLNTGGIQSVTNSRIAGSSYSTGEGARLNRRYVNRTLTGDPLLPWPMESRIRSEIGLSVADLVTPYLSENGGGNGGGDNGGGGSGGTGILSITLVPDAQVLRHNGSITIKVRVNSAPAGTTSMQIKVTDSAPGLTISPSTSTFAVPGETTIQVSEASANPGVVHVLKFTGQAQGVADVEQSLTVLVEPKLLFLPTIRNSR